MRSGRAGLRPVFRTKTLTIYAVPRPRSILTGPGNPRVAALTQSRLRLVLNRPGTYRLAVRWSPYWKAPRACLVRGADGMIRIRAKRSGVVRLRFGVDAEGAFAALAGRTKTCNES